MSAEGCILINERYRLGKRIGSGAFGEIHLGIDIKTSKEVAIKLESVKSTHPQLVYEAKVLGRLQGVGIPAVYWVGQEGDYNIMVMELLGPNLEELLFVCGRQFGLKTCLLIGLQMLDRIEYIHSKKFLHRDIKPENFLLGAGGNSSVLYAIDFGLSKMYIALSTGLHIPYKNNKNLTGTARYASVATHLGIEQSRRDDIEGILYTLLYFLKGSLPWQGLPARNKHDKYKKILQTKITASSTILCHGLPDEFSMMLQYVKSLKFEDEPDYASLKSTLKTIAMKNYVYLDGQFDWLTNPVAIAKFGFHKVEQAAIKEEAKAPLNIPKAQRQTPAVLVKVGSQCTTQPEPYSDRATKRPVASRQKKDKCILL